MIEDQLKDQLEVFSSQGPAAADSPVQIALPVPPGERAPARVIGATWLSSSLEKQLAGVNMPSLKGETLLQFLCHLCMPIFFLYRLLLISVLERNSLSVKIKCWNSKCILFHPCIFSGENWLLHLQPNPSIPWACWKKRDQFWNCAGKLK